jgi:hypothetical protein
MECEFVRAQCALRPTQRPGSVDEKLADTLCSQARSGAVCAETAKPQTNWALWLAVFVAMLALSRSFGFTLLEICI